jgi:hypothetical protein
MAACASEQHPLMVSAHTWEVERVGTTLATALRPLLKSAKSVLFVDWFFDISKLQYQRTLKAYLTVIQIYVGSCLQEGNAIANVVQRYGDGNLDEGSTHAAGMICNARVASSPQERRSRGETARHEAMLLASE